MLKIDETALVNALKFNADGLIPAIIQDTNTKEVLMMAWMNKESVELTINTGFTWFYSRSREKLWKKGETSGHVQAVEAIYYDCDGDTLLIKVEQTGVACHEGYYTCFHYKVKPDGTTEIIGEPKEDLSCLN